MITTKFKVETLKVITNLLSLQSSLSWNKVEDDLEDWNFSNTHEFWLHDNELMIEWQQTPYKTLKFSSWNEKRSRTNRYQKTAENIPNKDSFKSIKDLGIL